jgi:streptogramin lyase
MFKQRRSALSAFAVVAVCAAVVSALMLIPVGAQGRGPVLGGARGVVRTVSGVALEGIMVQVISQKTAIRTTVYTNEDGRYEFPKLDAGTYTLRIARPLEFKPWVKEGTQIDGATAMPDIVLERASKDEFLPPTPEVLSQLTGSEWMLNVPGTGEEKRLFSLMCGFGCHSYYEVFRNRYDEASWRLIVKRMQQGGGSPLINMAPDNPNTVGRAGRNLMRDQEVLIKWLARVRGPEAKDVAVHTLPASRGAATRAIITEYELPRELLALHDVHGDSKGRIWYTAHRSPWSGMLDPRTGNVTEYRIPATEAEDTPDALPGTHRVWVDKKDIVWFSEQWDHYLTGVDANTGKYVARWHFPTAARINSSGFSNFAMDDNGFAYETFEDSVVKIDSSNGQIVRKYPLKSFKQGTYDSIVTPDGRYWSGGPIGGGLQGLLDTQTGELWEIETRTPVESPSRGGYDAVTHSFWEGCRGGMLTKLDIKTRRLTEYYPPVPYETFYEALPDKNGEIWAGGLEGGRFWRYNPKTDRWVGYMMPEPWAHDRRTWIDNSTSPVTIWYVDQNGYMVRIQPLD